MLHLVVLFLLSQPPELSEPPLVEVVDDGACGALTDLARLDISRQRPAAPDDPVEDLWMSRCAMCHGRYGDGDTTMGRTHHARDFTDRRWQTERTDEELRCAILRGVPHTPMRAFVRHLTDEQVRGLVSLIRGFDAELFSAPLAAPASAPPAAPRHRTASPESGALPGRGTPAPAG